MNALANWRMIDGFPGYRMSRGGDVQTCWKYRGRGRGVAGEWYESDEWRSLSPENPRNGGTRFTIKDAGGTQQKLYVSHLLKIVWGVDNAQ